MRYNFDLFHKTGTGILADLLARVTGEPTPQEQVTIDCTEIHIIVVIDAENVFDGQTLERISLKGSKDEEYTVLLR